MDNYSLEYQFFGNWKLEKKTEGTFPTRIKMN